MFINVKNQHSTSQWLGLLHANISALLPKYKQLFADLLHCTNEPNVSIPTLANLLIERTQNPSWVVVYKALITTHHLMCYGNEVAISVSKTCNFTFFPVLQRFTQYLASSNSNFQLNGFLDKTGVQGESTMI